MAGHAARFRTFIDYVERHGLRHVFQPGEDPTPSTARVAAIDFPPAGPRPRDPTVAPCRGPSAASAARSAQAEPRRRVGAA